MIGIIPLALLLFVGVALASMYRFFAGRARVPRCGACRYPVPFAASTRCPECGGEWSIVGIIGRQRNIPARWAMVEGWLVLWVMLILIGCGLKLTSLLATSMQFIRTYSTAELAPSLGQSPLGTVQGREVAQGDQWHLVFSLDVSGFATARPDVSHFQMRLVEAKSQKEIILDLNGLTSSCTLKQSGKADTEIAFNGEETLRTVFLLTSLPAEHEEAREILSQASACAKKMMNLKTTADSKALTEPIIEYKSSPDRSNRLFEWRSQGGGSGVGTGQSLSELQLGHAFTPIVGAGSLGWIVSCVLSVRWDARRRALIRMLETAS